MLGQRVLGNEQIGIIEYWTDDSHVYHQGVII